MFCIQRLINVPQLYFQQCENVEYKIVFHIGLNTMLRKNFTSGRYFKERL